MDFMKMDDTFFSMNLYENYLRFCIRSSLVVGFPTIQAGDPGSIPGF